MRTVKKETLSYEEMQVIMREPKSRHEYRDRLRYALNNVLFPLLGSRWTSRIEDQVVKVGMAQLELALIMSEEEETEP